MKIKRIIVAASLALFSLNSQAHLVQGDWLTEGDGLSFLDTYSGVEWLKLTETKGMSINDVLADEKYAGWSVATSKTFERLIKNNIEYNQENLPDRYHSIIDDEERYFLSGASDDEGWSSNIVSLFGVTRNSSQYDGAFLTRYSYGLLQGVNLGYMYLTERTYSNSGRYEETFVYSVEHDGSMSEDVSLHYSGVFLYNTGGVTISSLSTPDYNVALKDVPINTAGFALIPFLMLAFRKKQ